MNNLFKIHAKYSLKLNLNWTQKSVPSDLEHCLLEIYISLLTLVTLEAIAGIIDY